MPTSSVSARMRSPPTPGDSREERAKWPLGLDEDLTIAEAFGLRRTLPQTFFVRADGTVAYRIYGRLDEQLVRQGLRAARTPA